MKMIRATVVMLAILQAGWIVLDGTRALILGEYWTPRIGMHGGKLGPWARVISTLGISPRSNEAKGLLVGYGVVWIGAALAFARGATWPWWVMVLATAGAFWYSGLTAPLSLMSLILLFVARRDI